MLANEGDAIEARRDTSISMSVCLVAASTRDVFRSAPGARTGWAPASCGSRKSGSAGQETAPQRRRSWNESKVGFEGTQICHSPGIEGPVSGPRPPMGQRRRSPPASRRWTSRLAASVALLPPFIKKSRPKVCGSVRVVQVFDAHLLAALGGPATGPVWAQARAG